MNSKEITNQLDRDGFVKIENVFTEEEIKKLSDLLISFSQNEANSLTGLQLSRKEGKVYSLHNLHRHLNEELKFVYLNKNLHQYLDIVLAGQQEMVAMEAFLKPAGLDLKTPIHQDDFYFYIQDHKGFNVWICIDKSTKENGCVFYYPGSHEWGLLNHESITLGTYQFKNDDRLKEIDRVFVEANPGDILIHNVLTVHGSLENNGTTDRKALTCVFRDKRFNEDKIRKNENLKKKFFELANSKNEK